MYEVVKVSVTQISMRREAKLRMIIRIATIVMMTVSACSGSDSCSNLVNVTATNNVRK